AAGDRVGVQDGRHLDHAVAAGGGLVEADALVAGDDGAAAVAVLQERVRRVHAGVDDGHRDAAAVERLPVRAGERADGLRAAGGGVGGLVEELDRAVALEVGDAGFAAGGLDLPAGARGDDDADLLELGDRPHARRLHG